MISKRTAEIGARGGGEEDRKSREREAMARGEDMAGEIEWPDMRKKVKTPAPCGRGLNL